MRDLFNYQENTVIQEKSCYVDRRAKEDALRMYGKFFPIFQYSVNQESDSTAYCALFSKKLMIFLNSSPYPE